MRLVAVTLLAAIGIGSLVGCSGKEPYPAGKPARISATAPFESYFGPAPTTDKGTCYAFVIFFPAADEPGTVVPFPFFSFDEASMKRVALERLIGGMEEKGYAGRFRNPFPKGTRLLSLGEQRGVVSANYSAELRPVAADPRSARELSSAVVQTLKQFPGVTGVRIQSEGADLFAAGTSAPGAPVVRDPAPPSLLKLVALKGEGRGAVSEVDALFDRPVMIGECRFFTEAGDEITGELFQSMFDMAAVLKPKEPGRLAKGTRVRVRFQVTDKRGRSARGEETLPLELQLHQD